MTWATTWQNKQCGCAPSEDSNQPGHLPSLIRVFAVRMKKVCLVPIKRTAKTLIRLGGCPGWSESSLGAQSLCWFCHVAAHLLNELFCIVQIIGQLQQYFGFLRKLTFYFAAQNVYSNTEAAKKYLLGSSPGSLSHLVPFFDYLSRKIVRDLPAIMENGMELCSTNILKCFLLAVSSLTEVTNNWNNFKISRVNNIRMRVSRTHGVRVSHTYPFVWMYLLNASLVYKTCNPLFQISGRLSCGYVYSPGYVFSTNT